METFGVEILDGIGSAEMFHIYITNRPGDVKPGSLGQHRARLRSADRRRRRARVPDRRDGHAADQRRLGGALLLERARKIQGDFCRATGARPAISFASTSSGYYWYCGRTDEMLKVGGIFVSPTEIENCLLEHEAVLEVRGHRRERRTEADQAESIRRAAREGFEASAAARRAS